MSARHLLQGWPQYALIAASGVLILRALYLSVWLNHGSRWAKWVVWASAAAVSVLGWYRL